MPKAFYYIAAFCFFVLPSFGQTSVSKIDSLINSRYKSGQFNGVAEVIKEGKIVYKKAFGFANFEKQTKLTTNSVFYLGSLSKQFTAMCVVLLKSRGLLEYDDKVTKYIPEFPFDDITIRHLLTHSSGLNDYINLSEEQWKKYPDATDKDMVKIIKDNFGTLQAMPGEKFLYSNTNYSLLVTVIEKVSEEKYEKFVRENIFKPLKMKQSFIKTEKAVAQKSVKGYIKNDSLNRYELPGQLNSLFGSPTSHIIGGGGIFSTMDDLYKWDQALYTDKLVSQDDLNEMFTQFTFNDGAKSRYGFGWNLYHRENDDFVMRHAGQFVGYLSIITRNVTRKETIVLLTNVTGNKDVANLVSLMTQMENILEDKK